MVYKTSDIVLAAYLVVSGCNLDRIEKQGQKGTFVFNNVKQDMIDAFNLNKARVEPIRFYNMVRQLTTNVRRVDNDV